MRIGYISGIIISGMIWLAIGCMLTFKGVFLLGSAIISTEKYWLIETLTRLCKNRDQATMFLVFIPVFIDEMSSLVSQLSTYIPNNSILNTFQTESISGAKEVVGTISKNANRCWLHTHLN